MTKDELIAQLAPITAEARKTTDGSAVNQAAVVLSILTGGLIGNPKLLFELCMSAASLGTISGLAADPD